MRHPTQGPHRRDDTCAPWPVSIKGDLGTRVIRNSSLKNLHRRFWTFDQFKGNAATGSEYESDALPQVSKCYHRCKVLVELNLRRNYALLE